MKISSLFVSMLFSLPIWMYGQNHSALDVQLGGHRSGIILENPLLKDEYIEHNGFHVGLHYQRKIGQRWWLRTGGRFTELSYKTPKKLLRWGTDFDPNTGLPRIDTTRSKVQFFHNHRYIEIPLLARYFFTNTKLGLYAELGFSSSFYLNTRASNIQDGIRISETQKDSNPFHLAGLAALGLNYQFTDQWSLFFQPSIRHDITPTAGKIRDRYSNYFYSYGIDVGGRIALN